MSANFRKSLRVMLALKRWTVSDLKSRTVLSRNTIDGLMDCVPETTKIKTLIELSNALDANIIVSINENGIIEYDFEGRNND